MPYENARSTRLLATRCCACGRALRDAESVELGIGPVCRRNHGFNLQVSAADRAEANALVHGIAARGRMTVEERNRLVALGFHQLAARLATRLLRRSRGTRRQQPIEVRMVIWRGVERLAVTTPYNPDALPAWRALGSWDASSRRWMVHRRDSVKLLDMLEQNYPGLDIHGIERPCPANTPAETECGDCQGRGYRNRTSGLCGACDGEGFVAVAAAA